MLVVMRKGATPEQIDHVVRAIEARGYSARPIPGGERTAVGILHNRGPVDPNWILGLPGVKEAIPVTRPYKLVSREFHPPGYGRHGGRCADRQRLARRHRGPLRRGKRRTGPDHRPPGEARRGASFPRRRLQAPHVSLRLSGARGRGPADPRFGCGGKRAFLS